MSSKRNGITISMNSTLRKSSINEHNQNFRKGHSPTNKQQTTLRVIEKLLSTKVAPLLKIPLNYLFHSNR